MNIELLKEIKPATEIDFQNAPNSNPEEELTVPHHLIPKGYRFGWIRYCIDKKSQKDKEIDRERLEKALQDGYLPVSAAAFPDLMTPAKKYYSVGDYIMYDGLILCGMKINTTTSELEQIAKVIEANCSQLKTFPGFKVMMQIEG